MRERADIEPPNCASIVGPYRWLEDQQSSETRAWIEAQNQYTRSLLYSLQGKENLRARIAPLHARKMTALMQTATASGRPVVLRYDIGARTCSRWIEHSETPNLLSPRPQGLPSQSSWLERSWRSSTRLLLSQ